MGKSTGAGSPDRIIVGTPRYRNHDPTIRWSAEPPDRIGFDPVKKGRSLRLSRISDLQRIGLPDHDAFRITNKAVIRANVPNRYICMNNH